MASAQRPVTALARSDEAARILEELGADVARGDLLDGRSLVEGMRGCTTAFNVAGVNAFCLRDSSTMLRTNVEGARRVVEAAAEAGVKRVIHTSSAATLGEESGTVGSEDSPHRGYFLSEYERSKYEGEVAVFDAGRRRGVDVVCVNPSSVQGPGRSGGTAGLLILYLRGRMKFFVPTTISLVDIDDCARGHVLAEERGRPGRRYVLNGAALDIEDALGIIAAIAGARARPRIVPGWVARAGGAGAQTLARLRGKQPRLCGEVVRTLLHGHAYDGSRATRELRLAYTPIETTLAKTVAWLRAEGLVPAA